MSGQQPSSIGGAGPKRRRTLHTKLEEAIGMLMMAQQVPFKGERYFRHATVD